MSEILHHANFLGAGKSSQKSAAKGKSAQDWFEQLIPKIWNEIR